MQITTFSKLPELHLPLYQNAINHPTSIPCRTVRQFNNNIYTMHKILYKPWNRKLN